MELREELMFGGSKRPRIDLEIPEEEGAQDSLTLSLKAVLTKKIADILGIGYVFLSETVAHGGFRDMNLEADVKFTDVSLQLKGDGGELESFYPDSIYSFRAYKIGGGGLGIQCKADVSGRLDELLDFFRNHRSDGFEFTIKPRQGELFEGGTRVELSEGDASVEVESDGPVQVELETPEATVSAESEPSTDRSYENGAAKRGRGRKVRSINKAADDKAFIN